MDTFKLGEGGQKMSYNLKREKNTRIRFQKFNILIYTDTNYYTPLTVVNRIYIIYFVEAKKAKLKVEPIKSY